MQNENVTYDTDGPVAIVTLNRPRYRNAQSWGLLDGVDEAFNLAEADDNVRVIVVRGAGEHFSSGHDLGTPESIAEREIRGASDEGLEFYQNFRKYNIDYLLKWRNSPKPSISTVRGYCIFAGWMLAAATDLVFADTSARFLPGLVEYFTQPWDLGVRKAKELIFESRFGTRNHGLRPPRRGEPATHHPPHQARHQQGAGCPGFHQRRRIRVRRLRGHDAAAQRWPRRRRPPPRARRPRREGAEGRTLRAVVDNDSPLPPSRERGWG
ncbi:enoyl-CoA hydratase/isomerase family protein [bacterium]|nr:enoyl-CoA hydratase/isomerase family protein [bacterium]